MATNEEITSSVDKVSDLGSELKLISFSHMLSLSVVGTEILSCFVFRSLVLQIRCYV